ncbi:MAG: diguanylate cyclase, partial [Lachnospiraceae bacterium]|nr:diguanylate cyclase [Lachnospiraceae bacterium]
YFKQINDNYGHSAGDNALRILAGEIANMVKGKGGFAGRWGRIF